MRKTMMVAAAALIGGVSAAAAADLGGYGSMKDEPVTAYVPNWAGLYAGVNAGYAWGDADWDWKEFPNGVSTDLNGGIFGGQIGYNFQHGNWVVGAEVSFSGGNADGAARCPNPDFTCKSELDWLLTAGPRIGYARDNWLGYVAGGYALASITTTEDPLFRSTVNDTQQHSGWAIGGGVEYLISPNVIFGVEYLHVALSSETHAASDFEQDHPEIRDIDPELDIVRARLSYKFGRDDEPLK
jgi:outer membrane immunogenic protein